MIAAFARRRRSPSLEYRTISGNWVSGCFREGNQRAGVGIGMTLADC